MSRPVREEAWVAARPVLAVAAAWWLVADCVAVWGPSLITVFGQAASTPPEYMGLFALGCVLLATVVVPVTSRFPVVTLVVALLARTVLAVSPGGHVQLWTASVGVVAGFAWFAHVAGRHGPALAPGLATGWLLQSASAAAGGTWLAVWRPDALGAAVLAALAALNLACLVPSRSSGAAAAEPPSRRMAWSALPLALVAGVAVVNPGRASTVDPRWGPLLLVVGCALAVAVLVLRPGLAASRVPRAALALAAVAAVALTLFGTTTRDGVPGSLAPWVLVAFVLGPTALAALLTWDAPRRGSAATRSVTRGALAVGGGAVLWVVLFFAYYAGYDLGYRADVVLLVALAALGVWAVLRGGGSTPATGRSAAVVPLVALALLATVTAAVGAYVHRPPEVSAAPAAGEPLRVVAWNLRMGYGMDGTFDPQAVADVVRDADVVLLSEIDRGWLLNGGQDQLAILSRETGLPLHFAPAADPVWGDAILTRLPVEEVRGVPLPSYGAVTGAGALAARLTTGSGPLWVVSTHVQPTDTRDDGTLDQAQDLADLVEELGEDGTVPVVLGGDFNFEPGTPSFAAVRGTGLADALAGVRPLPTFDAADPVKEIDHLFVDPSWRVVDAGRVETLASDHLPVWVELAAPSP